VSFLTVIADHSAAVLAVCIPALLASGGYVVWRTVLGGGSDSSNPATPPPATRVTPRRPMAPMPSTKPRSMEVGQAEHQARGEAKTVKVPTTPTGARDERKVDTARMPTPAISAGEETIKDELFSGLAEVKDDHLHRKAERMEELGFHAHAKQIPVLNPTEAAARSHTELLAAANAAKLDNASTVAIPAVEGKPVEKQDPKRNETRVLDAPPSAPAARTQTQELDDILSRIDKVLSENPVMAQSTIGSASNETGVIVKPTTDTVAKKPTEAPVDPQQQKLF
jgi:hypothetical protein